MALLLPGRSFQAASSIMLASGEDMIQTDFCKQ
jgi:hypothetical protein